MIESPLADVGAWLRYFDASALPILRNTRASLTNLIARGDSVSAHDLGDVAKHDALLSLQILRYLQLHRSVNQLTDVTTVDRAILMVGVTPLLDKFAQSDEIETVLQEHPHGLETVLQVMQRAYLSGICAARWGSFRNDVDAAEVMTSALLRDIAEVLIGVYSPKLALRIRAIQQHNSTIRSAVAQRAVLGFPIFDLQLALIDHWRLPPMLRMLMDEEHAENPRVRIVKTAVTFSRHIKNGWDDPAVPDDLLAISELCGVDLDSAKQLAESALAYANSASALFSVSS